MTKILVVDDDPDILSMLGRFLKAKGFEVFYALDGLQALAVARRERPDVVFLDVSMPGPSGVEVLGEIKKFDEGIDVIMVTGDTEDETGRRAMAAGAFDYIIKPFTLDYLEKVLTWKLRMR
jgi:DNA-binding response OmpR family regulator